MDILVSDKPLTFSKINGHYLLVKDTNILETSILKKEDIVAVNSLMNGAEFIAERIAIRYLNRIIYLLNKNKFSFNSYLSINNPEYNLYASCNYFLRENFKDSIKIILLLKKISLKLKSGKNNNIIYNLHLSDENIQLFTFLKSNRIKVNLVYTIDYYYNYKTYIGFINKSFKNIAYQLKYMTRSWKRKTGSQRKHILLILNDLDHHQHVLKNFIHLLSITKEFEISLVITSSGINPDYKNYSPPYTFDDMHFYMFSAFCKGTFTNRHKIYKSASIIGLNRKNLIITDPLYDFNLIYEWMGNVFKALKPDICLNIGTHFYGRALSDVARYFKTPSISIDYGLFSFDPSMDSKIKFDYRACLGQASIEVWKHCNDPSLHHVPIGFCKFDEINFSQFNKENFMTKHNLIHDKTIFFASTSNTSKNDTYSEEKKTIITFLSNMCHKKRWNLIIKKHPLETDSIIEDALQKNNFPCQKSFSHHQISIYEAIYYSDVVANQMSSIVLECIYFRKPFCYITTSTNYNQTAFSILKKEKIIETFSDFRKFEQFCESIMYGNDTATFTKKLELLSERYLYKTDGKASQRLLELVIKILQTTTT
ncbi:MAG: hypothetical protein HYU69_02370 [Bacteroidetes bacterium]|nr:hypothetical protein [Bacteroidota bacterium]